MKLEEILFGLIGTGGSWDLNVKTHNGEGKIFIKNTEIIDAYYKTSSSSFSGERALILIIEDADLVDTIDLYPLKGDLERKFKCDFSVLMNLFENRSISKNNLDSVEIEFEEDSSEFPADIITEEMESSESECLSEFSKKTSRKDSEEIVNKISKDFTELLQLCSEVFSSGAIKAVLLIDKATLFKIEGNISNAEDIDIVGLFTTILSNASSFCGSGNIMEITVNLQHKFVYWMCDIKKEKGIMAIIDNIEKGSFELDKTLIYETFLKALKTI